MSETQPAAQKLSQHARDLLSAACPTPEDTPFFNHCMALAKAQGLSWEEGLAYVVRCRRDGGR